MKTTDEVRDKMAPAFSIEKADDRKLLIAALQEKGITAHEIAASEFVCVSVALIPETATEQLSIDAVAYTSRCPVGVSGWRLLQVGPLSPYDEDYIECMVAETRIAESLTVAVRAFVHLLSMRELLVAKFREGAPSNSRQGFRDGYERQNNENN